MKNQGSLELRFNEVFQPIFYWGVGALEFILVLYSFYLEFVTGSGPSLFTAVLPLSIAIAVAWAVASALITLAIVSLKYRSGRKNR